MGRNNFDNVTMIAKMYIDSVVKEGDICIDATMGKGNDTLYLAEKAGKSGFVYAFDIQEEAITKTSEKLNEKGLLENTKLIHDGHENIDLYVDKKIKCAVFNLGYLPGFGHEVITKPDTTIKAIEKSVNLLEDNGIVSICMYTGHEGGMDEKNAVVEYASSLDQREYNVSTTRFINQANNPPEIILIEKKK